MKKILIPIVVLILTTGSVTGISGSDRYKFSASYTFDLFGRDYVYGPWHLGSLDLSRKFEWGTLIGRTSLAQRRYSSSNPLGVQFEVDAYPKLTPIRKSTYAYLNFGYSPTTLFPLIRAGAEIYTGLPYHLETSLGARYLFFDPKNVFIFTGSLGLYYKDYWFSIRPYITPKDEGISVSGHFITRRYWSDDNYISFTLGLGSSPEEIDYSQDTTRHGSIKAGTGMQWALTSTLLLKGGISFEYEEYRTSQWGPHFTLSAGIAKTFSLGRKVREEG